MYFEPYPLESFPHLANLTIQERENQTRAPLALCAAPVLGAMSIAASALVDVELPTGKICPATCNSITLAEANERKSENFRRSTAGILAVEQEQSKKYGPDLEEYFSQRRIYDAIEGGLLAEIRKRAKKFLPTIDQERQLREHALTKPARPNLGKLLYYNPTPEALLEGLAKDWPCVGLFSDEAGTILNGRGFADIPLLNKVLDGNTTTNERVNTDTICAKDPRVTLMLMVQPEPFRKMMLRRGVDVREMGLLARCFISFPASTQGRRQLQSLVFHSASSIEFDERIKAMLKQALATAQEGQPKRELLHLSSDAKLDWLSLYNDLETAVAEGGYAREIPDFAGKLAETAVRLAAIFHCFEGRKGDISIDTFKQAASVCFYYLNEFNRLFGSTLGIAQEFADAERLERWLVNKSKISGYTSFPIRYVYQCCTPVEMRKAGRVKNSLILLAEQGKVQFGTEGKTQVVRLNHQLTQILPPSLSSWLYIPGSVFQVPSGI